MTSLINSPEFQQLALVFGQLLPVFLWLMAAVGGIIHFFFAAAIYKNACRLSESESGVWLVGPWIWFFATLFGGILTVIAFWMIHHSTLRPAVVRKSDN